MLYVSVAKSVKEICGRKGVECLGKGIRMAGRQYGFELREQFRAEGIPTNLKTLFAAEPHCWDDPRMRAETEEWTPEVMRCMVYTCPFADTCLDAGIGDMGNMFCEQWLRGVTGAFTQDVDKFYLTKKLMVHRTNGCRPDNHCKFSVFYRKALTQGQQMEESFPETPLEKQPKVPVPQEKLHRKYVLLLTHWAKILQEELGSEGKNALAEGLRSLVSPTAQMMRHYAEMRLAKDLAVFSAENLPLCSDESSETSKWDDKETMELFLINFYRPLHKMLDI